MGLWRRTPSHHRFQGGCVGEEAVGVHVGGIELREESLPRGGHGNGGDRDLGAVEDQGRWRPSAAMSIRWLTRCSVPESGAVFPAIPREIPLRVSTRASRSNISGSPAQAGGSGEQSSALLAQHADRGRW